MFHEPVEEYYMFSVDVRHQENKLGIFARAGKERFQYGLTCQTSLNRTDR